MCLYVLMTTSDLAISAPDNTIILTVGVVWTCLSSTVGMVAVSALSFVLNIRENAPQTRMLVPLLSALQVLKEMRVLVWIFVMQNLPEVAFLVYLMYKVRPFLSGWLEMVKMNYVH